MLIKSYQGDILYQQKCAYELFDGALFNETKINQRLYEKIQNHFNNV